MQLYKGFVPTKDKKCLMPFKNATSEELLSYEQVKGLPEYAGILSDDTILVDVDDMDQSMVLLTIIETLGLKCRVYDPPTSGNEPGGKYPYQRHGNGPRHF